MFSVITNIYNKKTQGPTLMELFTATGKLKNCFFDNWGCSMCAVSPVAHKSNISSFQKNIFVFPVAVNSSIKVGPWVFLL
jgi:hypothetical protein